MRPLFFYILLLLSLQLPAQLQQKYLFSSLSSRNGLVSEETTGVQQDTRGFIWIATRDGLQRYDNRRFLTYRYVSGDSRSLPNDIILQMKIDNKDRLWLICKENRLGYFNTSELRFHEVPVLLPKEELRNASSQLIIDGDNDIFLVIYGIGIFRYDETQDKFLPGNLPFRYPKDWNPVSITHDKPHGVYWILCDSGLAKYNSVRKSLSYRNHNTDQDSVIANYASLLYVSNLYPDKAGRYWLLSGTARNPGIFLYSYDRVSGIKKDWKIFDLDKSVYQEMYDIDQQEDGTIWIMGTSLFAQLNEKTGKFTEIPSNLPGQFSIRYEAIRQLYEDRENNLWICSNKGVYRFNPTGQFFHNVINYRPETAKTDYHQQVSDIIQTTNGDIIVSTFGDGSFLYDSSFRAAPFAYTYSKTNEDFITCLYQQRSGVLWRGQPYGSLIISYPNRSVEKIRIPEFNNSLIRQITEDNDGNTWIGAQNGKLVKWTAATKKFSLVHDFGNCIRRLLTDKKGDIWICTEQEGVYKINTTLGNILAHYSTSGAEGKRLLSNYSSDIIQYNDTLYVIAAGGINLLNARNNTIDYTGTHNELPSNTVTNVIKDRTGNLWVTTQSGICSINMKNYVVTNYNERDGVHTNSFSDGAACLLQDGRIAIGTPHDWMVFDPSLIAKSGLKNAPDITIAQFAQMNKWLSLDSLKKLPVIELPYDQNSVTIEFTTLTYQSSYGIFYMLENLDKDWQLSRLGNQAVYNYLPPGTYTFKAMCKSADGTPSKNLAILKIKIKSPFWKTWWFLGMLVFVGIYILYWLDKLRMQKLRATESIRTRIATSLTEDMSNSLSNINISSELAKTKIDTDTERTKEYISAISDTSNRMVQAMYDMVWSINPSVDTMGDTIDRMKSFAGEIENLYQLNVDFDVDKQVSNLKLDMEHRYELLSVFKEAITNAGKHSGGRFVKVSIRYKKQKLMMMIVDDGKGFNMDNLAMLGRGISDMRRRSAAINASFYIESEINTGTIVKLELPV